MQCPNCALYHPSRYDQCVSCGTSLVADNDLVPPPPSVSSQMGRGIRQAVVQSKLNTETQTSDDLAPRQKGGMPTFVGVLIAAFILCVSAGVTFFFLTKPPENQRLLTEGQHQLALGQYAFALKTLNEALKAKPNDPKILLALARAYVGVDQVDKAWDLIVQAQQLGAGVVADPELASDLANYYRQKGQYQRAIELLRPLAANNVAGKKAELADLDASWGDQALQDGDVKQALTCWEEVRDLHDGGRFTEADSRLATIYQKIGDEMMRKGNDEEALKYYSKLNAMTPNAAVLERTADLYQKDGKLELAIDQLRQAVKLSSEPDYINRKLAAVMTARGKELLDKGDADAGYGYLQQAAALDPKTKAPPTTIRDVHFDFDPKSGVAHISGEVWNASEQPINTLIMHAELYENKSGRTLWSKDLRVIDEFVPPLASRDARSFDIASSGTVPDPKSTELRVYLNSSLYRTYPLVKGGADSSLKGPLGDLPRLRPRIPAPAASPSPSPVPRPGADGMPPAAPNRVNEQETTPLPAPTPGTPMQQSGPSPEEKTLKDLE
ncbi:MAG TPA: tetratricopeptide repeat protein [Candidatus Obscuribacterales bacterium]